MSKLEEAVRKIAEQQTAERTPVWMVGEQLKELLRDQPELAEIVLEDLDGKPEALAKCEKKIKEFADRNKKGHFACVIPAEAERIIREFFGLPKRGERPAEPRGKPMLNLVDFL